MAPSRPHPKFPLLRVVALLGALSCALPRPLGAWALQLPTHPRDLLPLLPHPVNHAVLGMVASPVDILPAYVASLLPHEAATWQGACFRANTGYLNLTDPSNEEPEGGFTINVVTSAGRSWTCLDLYVFGTPWRVIPDYYFFSRHHSFHVKWLHNNERDYVLEKGVSAFLMPAGFLGTVRALWDVIPLFSGTSVGEAAQLRFLKRRMGARFVKRKGPLATNMTARALSRIQSGDFIVTSKVRGFWGGFETLQKWVTGSTSGHTAMFMRDANGTLWVAESGHLNRKKGHIIVKMRWDEWWAAQLSDPDEPHVAVVPLHPRLRARFNESAAWAFVDRLDGRPFGYHNIIFAWIDTPADNFPPPIDAQLAAAVMSIWVQLQPEYASKLWNEALNKRLGTEGLDVPGVLTECAKRKIPFGDLLSVPEQDDWRYSDGQSTTCVSYVMSAWKEAGILGPHADDIQVTEFTIKDAYQLNLFNDDPAGISDWCDQGGNEPLVPYCQILGKWKIELPGYNSLELYPHMNEHCPSLAPDYIRPDGC